MKFKAQLRHSPEYFNRVCQATIPEYWECEVVEFPQEVRDAEKMDMTGVHFRLYGTSQDSAQDAVNDLVEQLKANGWHGTLKVLQ